MQTITIALIFNGLDFLTGTLQAIKQKSVESSKMRNGMFKKVGFVCCYALGYLIDYGGSYVGINLGFSALSGIIGYVIATEVVSIIENIAKLNEQIIPKKLLEILKIGG